MSGPMRFRFAAGFILAGLATSPASSNPFTALFNSAPEQTAAPVAAKDAPAKEECLPRPGKPADGQHWMYRVDGHRKCWFPVAAESVAAKKPVRRYAARRQLDAADDNRDARPRREAVEDARAEVLRPTAAETLQPAPPAPPVKMVDVKVVDVADAAPLSGAAAMVPPPPVLSKADRFKPDDSNPRMSNPEALLAAAPADSEAGAVSAPAATPVVDPIIAKSDERRWWTAPWLGRLLLALGGLILLLSPIWPRPRAALVAERPWCPEAEDREDPPDFDFSPRTRPREDQTQATSRSAPRRPRQTIEDRSRSRPRLQTKQDMTLQEAFKVLTDFDAISAEGRSSALPSRSL